MSAECEVDTGRTAKAVLIVVPDIDTTAGSPREGSFGRNGPQGYWLARRDRRGTGDVYIGLTSNRLLHF